MNAEAAKNEFRMPAKEFDRIMKRALQAPRSAKTFGGGEEHEEEAEQTRHAAPKVDAPGPMPCVPYSFSVVKCIIPG